MQYPTSPPPDLVVFKRLTQVIYFVLFGTVGLYWVVLEMLAASVEPRDLGTIKHVLFAVAAGSAGFVLYLRFARIPPLLDQLTGDFSRRFARLRYCYLLCHVLSEAVALYGFVVRMLGGAREEAVPFFVGAVALFLLCYPRLPQTPGSPAA